MENTLKRGDLVRVGKSVGVLTHLETETLVEEHVGIWYGEVDPNGKPRVRTVPVEYVVSIAQKDVSFYH